MLIGAMNHPAEDVIAEISWMAEIGMDFVDLTLEPPAAAAWQVDVKVIRKALRDLGLRVVGHTAYYLPLASPFESIRKAAVEELKQCLRIFGRLGAPWMNLHPGRKAPMQEWRLTVDRNLRSLQELLPLARECGVGLMIENLPGEFNTVEELSELLEPLPELGLHLDLGHTNLLTKQNTADGIIAAYGSRLRHVHLHDNKGGSADLHLPLGVGMIDIPHYLRSLRAIGYDGTITLEVFTPDRWHLAYSRDVLLKMWAASAPKSRRAKPPAARTA